MKILYFRILIGLNLIYENNVKMSHFDHFENKSNPGFTG